MNFKTRNYLSKIGRSGGLKSRRALSSEQAQLMVRVREAKRLFKKHYAQCFWSYDPNYKVTSKDIKWIAEQLKKHGNRQMWQLGAKLCR